MDVVFLVSDRSFVLDFVRGCFSVLSMMSGFAEWMCLVPECMVWVGCSLDSLPGWLGLASSQSA